MMKESVRFFTTEFRKLAGREQKDSVCYRPRTYRNAAVRFRPCAVEDFEGRQRLLEAAGLNAFFFPAGGIPGCDLLSDSGTTTMTMEQWSQLLLGDEAYGSNEGYFELKEQVASTFGPHWRQQDPKQENLFIFHQGRAAEHALSTVLKARLLEPLAGNENDRPESRGRAMVQSLTGELRSIVSSRTNGLRGRFLVIPSNSHFDTTEANFEACNLAAANLQCEEHRQGREDFPFRGNMDTGMLVELLERCGELVPLVYLTITNNTGGGQPVSMQNIRAVREVANRFKVPFFFDACRFAENAWFIRQQEPGYSDKPVPEIVHEMFSYVDGFHISFKKDGLANIGGALVLRQDGRAVEKYPFLADMLTGHQILAEGHPTYGGLAGRDLKAIAEGLRTVTREQYLASRTDQVRRFGQRLTDCGVPVIRPIGGSAVYIDVDRFFDREKKTDPEFHGVALTALLLLAGHRLCELGVYAFGKQKEDGSEEGPDPWVNYVRAAVPRLAYEDQDLFACAEAIRLLHDNRDRIPGVNVTYGRELALRHFKSRFEFRA
jgi:tryptophanase